MISRRYLIFPYLSMLLVVMTVSLVGQGLPDKDSGMELKMAVLLSRHGIRSPLPSEQETAQRYSSDSWPRWTVSPGLLTLHGRRLMILMGSFYREFYGGQGLFPGSSCGSARGSYFYSDRDQRNIDSAQAVAEGMFPQCQVEIGMSRDGRADSIISPIEAGLGTPDSTLAAAAMRGRIGDSLDALERADHFAFVTLEKVLLGCEPSQCPPRTGKNGNLLFSLGSIRVGVGNRLIEEMNGTYGVSSRVAEVLLLEYVDGIPMPEVGWGRMNHQELTQIQSIRNRYFDLTQRTRYIAQVRGSNLLSHISNSLAQSASTVPVPGSFGTPADKLIFISAHDTNIANVGALIGAQWLVPGGQFNPAFPGGALAFELRQKKVDGSYWVRVRYISQTPAQMRSSQPLTLQAPPALVAIFLPGCSTADEGFDCRLDTFQTLVRGAVDEKFVTH